MEKAQEAVKALEKSGLKVQGLRGPNGWRFQIANQSGDEWQISDDELLQLQSQHRLNLRGVREIVKARI
jgi:adenylate cyclase